MFSRVSILGGGLLGGSLALALARLVSGPEIRTWFRHAEVLPDASEIGIPGPTSDLKVAVESADLLVLAVPVGAMHALVEKAISAGLPSSCVITDVGSVKGLPHESLQPLLDRHGLHFIGSHPMAGSEQKGIAAANPSLFSDAACLLTNDNKAPEPLCSQLENFWQTVGCRTTWMSADDHDDLVAAISHLPHVVAAATARISLSDPSKGVYGGGGLRDTTRVASGDPDMWAEILIENRQAVAPLLRGMISDLGEALTTLEQENLDVVRSWLVDAKALRDQLKPKPQAIPNP